MQKEYILQYQYCIHNRYPLPSLSPYSWLPAVPLHGRLAMRSRVEGGVGGKRGPWLTGAAEGGSLRQLGGRQSCLGRRERLGEGAGECGGLQPALAVRSSQMEKGRELCCTRVHPHYPSLLCTTTFVMRFYACPLVSKPLLVIQVSGTPPEKQTF